MPRFTLRMHVFLSISLETYKCVLKPQNSTRFSKMIALSGHMPRFTFKNEHFPIYLLRSTIHVC